MNDNEKVKVERIRSQYAEQNQTVSDFERLKELDKRLKNPAKIFSYVFGSVATLVLGAGMCLAMKVIGNSMAAGIVIGCVGIALVSVTYPLYKSMLEKRKRKYSRQVLSLSNSLLNQ